MNDVFVYLDDKSHPASLKGEAPDQTSFRMINFLKLLKFNFPTTDIDRFASNLVAGERSACYSVLTWLLQKLPLYRKKAYVARYLAGIEIPMDFMSDPAIQELQVRVS